MAAADVLTKPRCNCHPEKDGAEGFPFAWSRLFDTEAVWRRSSARARMQQETWLIASLN